MKRIDYFWPRAAVQVTGIVFVSQLIVTATGIPVRKPEYWWVIYACAAAFVLALVCSLGAVLINAMCSRNTDGGDHG